MTKNVLFVAGSCCRRELAKGKKCPFFLFSLKENFLAAAKFLSKARGFDNLFEAIFFLNCQHFPFGKNSDMCEMTGCFGRLLSCIHCNLSVQPPCERARVLVNLSPPPPFPLPPEATYHVRRRGGWRQKNQLLFASMDGGGGKEKTTVLPVHCARALTKNEKGKKRTSLLFLLFFWKCFLGAKKRPSI